MVDGPETGLSGPHALLPRLAVFLAAASGRVASASGVEPARAAAPTIIPPLLGLTALVILCLVLVVFWVRQHRDMSRHAMMAALNSLAEDLLLATSAAELLRKLEETVPGVLNVTGIQIYLWNRHAHHLMRVPSPDDPSPQAFDPDAPPTGLPSLVAQAFRGRQPLVISDSRRTAEAPRLPRSLLLAPMFAQGDAAGVLVLYRAARPGDFSADERAAVQHVANQAAAALELEEQQRAHEQLARTGNLAATGQLISEVAAELREPIENILAAARDLAKVTDGRECEHDVRIIAEEARRASGMISRLASFGSTEAAERHPVDISELLSRLLRFRDREQRALGVEMRAALSDGALYTESVRPQLERLFLDVLLHAERVASEANDKTIHVSSSAIGHRVSVVIGWEGGTTPSNLAEWRRIASALGGEARFAGSGASSSIEVELPLSGTGEAAPSPEGRRRTRVLTTLVIEPDQSLQARLVYDLSARLHRVVPVPSGEEGIDLAHRMRFDVVFCSTRLPGAGWRECLERIAGRTGAFVVLADGFEIETGPLGRNGLLLHKASYDGELDTVLAAVDDLTESQAPSATRS